MAGGSRHYSNSTYRKLRIAKRAGLYAGVALVLVYMLFPYYWAIISSTKSREDLYSFSLLPSLDFSNYITLYHNPIFIGAIVNSAFVALTSSVISLVISILGGLCTGADEFPVFPHHPDLRADDFSFPAGSCLVRNVRGYRVARSLQIGRRHLSSPISCWCCRLRRGF